jgi:hypothetical protein
MKTIQNLKKCLTLFVLATCFTLSSMQCEKDQILPPVTQTGADTFGCLVDGKIFLPKGSLFSPPSKQLYYQFVNGVYHFSIGISNKINKNDKLKSLNISAHGLTLEEKTYKFGIVDTPGIFGGSYSVYHLYDNGTIDEYSTDPILQGEITITKFDQVNYIISGTFWFDAINKDGKKVEVREGRFDMHYIL